VAYNKELLKELGIAHLINLAGDVCLNKFKQDFQYRTYHLKDWKDEVIYLLTNLRISNVSSTNVSFGWRKSDKKEGKFLYIACRECQGL
jgi:hypothetical protein